MLKRQLAEKLTSICLAILLCACLNACKQKGCTDIKACNFDSKAKENSGCDYSCCETGTVTANGDSVKINYYGNETYAIAVFTIKKDHISFPVNCEKPQECKNYVKVTNITDYNISFSYIIDYKLNTNTWQFQNSVSNLAPGKNTGFIYINNSCESIVNATITITGS